MKGRPPKYPGMQDKFESQCTALFANSNVNFSQFKHVVESLPCSAEEREWAAKNMQNLVKRSVKNGVVTHLGRGAGYRVR